MSVRQKQCEELFIALLQTAKNIKLLYFDICSRRYLPYSRSCLFFFKGVSGSKLRFCYFKVMKDSVYVKFASRIFDVVNLKLRGSLIRYRLLQGK